MVGRKGTKAVLLTLTERKTRLEIVRRLPNKKQKTIKNELKRIRNERGDIFKTITFDNGSGFLDFKGLEGATGGQDFLRASIFELGARVK